MAVVVTFPPVSLRVDQACSSCVLTMLALFVFHNRQYYTNNIATVFWPASTI